MAVLFWPFLTVLPKLFYPNNPILVVCAGSTVLAVLFWHAVLAALSLQSAFSVLPVSFRLFRFSCPVLSVLLWLSSPSCSVFAVFLAVLCWQPYPSSPILTVLSYPTCPGTLSWQSCPACPALAIRCWLSFSGYLLLSLLSWHSSPSSRCPDSPVPAALFS